MIIKNVWKDVEPPLELHEDERGAIADIFYQHPVDHIAIITSKAGALRGNHYHKFTTQHMLITKGSLEYWHKSSVDSPETPEMTVARVGDLVSTPPNEVHALRIGPDGCEFVVFSEGQRGGKDYETDTFRTDNIIGEAS